MEREALAKSPLPREEGAWATRSTAGILLEGYMVSGGEEGVGVAQRHPSRSADSGDGLGEQGEIPTVLYELDGIKRERETASK
jgi:hypothetical protein